MSQLVPYLNFGLDFSSDPSATMYSENFFNGKTGMFIALEGLNSGVPTRTTPTLTPTTLRNIEQTFIELQPEQHENEAGFVPPLVHSIGNNQYVSASEASTTYLYQQPPVAKSPSIWQSSNSQSSTDSNTRSTPPPLTTKTNFNNTPPHHQGGTKRNMGGRKPMKDDNISPEEEERRRIRRERNKAAAARCRKRRVDHTNALVKEVEELEDKRQKLMEEKQQLKELKNHLECLLETHRMTQNCKLRDSPSSGTAESKTFVTDHIYYDKTLERVKTEVIEEGNDVFLLPSPTIKTLPMLNGSVPKPPRPSSLNVALAKNELAGIPITTPSHGMTFNFESLMGGGTGLTPVSTPLVPTCSTQQRNMPANLPDLVSPDSQHPHKLVTL
ncbi:transcription factor kayak isoform X2 [Anthonomus grandis grandis]|uniref:transcription factor kayak isoform X2 n=1 Tax=Anthonomus grandis grandis TaxID=2921223 RepID=UPI0021661FF7|nr:transcription factor kayak isoform X2 [Anthonomus grandis grandis]